MLVIENLPVKAGDRNGFDRWVGKTLWKRDRLPTAVFLDFPCGSAGKESACNAVTWVGKIPWRREKLPTPIFWPGESHGLKSLASYSPQGCKDSDMTEVT